MLATMKLTGGEIGDCWRLVPQDVHREGLLYCHLGVCAINRQDVLTLSVVIKAVTSS